MSLHALRRWFTRHPAEWVLGVALGLTLTLGGAQLAAAEHEISHLAPSSETRDLHAGTGHDCPTCLLAAALGGAATAPSTPFLIAPETTAAASLEVEHDFTPRFALAYASRAPPVSRVIAT